MANQKVRCRVMLEVLGRPKEHVEESLKSYINYIKEDKKFEIFQANFFETKPVEDNLWTAFAELEMTSQDLLSLISFCFDYMPSVIEILEPEQLVLKDREVTEFINDLQARLHQVDAVAKQAKIEIDTLRKSLNNLLKNYIQVLLAQRSMNSEQLSQLTGVSKDKIEDFLDSLVDEKIVRTEGENYFLIEEK